MNAFKTFMIFSFVLTLSAPVAAVQKITANPDEAVQIVASRNDANIISITGGSIESVWGTEDKVALEANVDTGQAIFRPISDQPFTLFVTSEAGNTYALSVVPRDDVIGQTILLDEFNLDEGAGLDRTLKAVAYKTEVKRLLKEIEQTSGLQRLPGFRLKTINKTVPVWAETEILHAATWQRSNMAIEKYVITNISDQPLTLKEREFAHLGPMVRAVSIKSHSLAPAATTVMYIFRSES